MAFTVYVHTNKINGKNMSVLPKENPKSVGEMEMAMSVSISTTLF